MNFNRSRTTSSVTYEAICFLLTYCVTGLWHSVIAEHVIGSEISIWNRVEDKIVAES